MVSAEKASISSAVSRAVEWESRYLGVSPLPSQIAYMHAPAYTVHSDKVVVSQEREDVSNCFHACQVGSREFRIG